MSTSDTDNRRSCINQSIGTGAGAAFWALFGAIYEHYSHSVYSYFMIYAFAPLMTASLVYSCAARFSKNPPGRATRNLFTAFAATASIGMVATGVVEIYGSTNKWLKGYVLLASAALVAAAISRLTELTRAKRKATT